MHRSRLAGFIIDCQTDDLEGGATFWSAALGLPLRGGAADDPGYRIVMEAPTGHRFCIVNPQSKDFSQNANRWE